ncbi:MAG: hypothetical protein KC877_00770, partial [Candidatus Kaiserbacteria bacterium]|nr:hypothetical protein [Candidatus Kaiserbacteria bacterium]
MPSPKQTKTVKKTTQAVKKTAKKSARKSVRKAAPKKAVAKKTAVKKVASKKKSVPQPKPEATASDAVTLPSAVPPAVLSKSNSIREFDRDFRHAMYLIAYVSSFCFMLVGSTMLASGVLSTHNLALKAETISISTTTDGTLSEPTNLIPPPHFDLMSPVPTAVDEPFTIKFLLRSTENVRAYLVSAPLDFRHELPLNGVTTDTYSVLIPYVELERGFYRVVVTGKALIDNELVTFDTPVFEVVIPEPTPVEEVDNSGTGNAADGTSSTDVSTDGTDADAVVPDVTGATDTTLDDTPTTDAVDTVQTTDDNATGLVVVEDEEPADEPEPAKLDLRKNFSEPASGFVTLTIDAPLDLRSVEIYARNLKSTERTFVSLAFKSTSGWKVVFNTKNFANGEYELHAVTQADGVKILSNPVKVKIYNAPTTVTNTVTEPVLDAALKTNGTEPTSEPFPVSVTEPKLIEEPKVREFITVETESEDSAKKAEKLSTETLQPRTTTNPLTQVERDADTLLRTNSTDLNTLLKNYASAKQSGDQILIDAAKKALAEKRESLIQNTVASEEGASLVSELSVKVTERIEDLQNRIDTFEQLRKDRSAGETATDSDGDGISDIDERTLYGTDPNTNDSDGDGIADGIEIMRGYNPKDASAEAIIEFESPKETIGVEREEELIVKEVAPVVAVENNNTDRR